MQAVRALMLGIAAAGVMTSPAAIAAERYPSRPIHFISGSENRMFIPESTEASYKFLCDANGASYYRRSVYEGFGHLDCYFGSGAPEAIWPDIANSLAA